MKFDMGQDFDELQEKGKEAEAKEIKRYPYIFHQTCPGPDGKAIGGKFMFCSQISFTTNINRAT